MFKKGEPLPSLAYAKQLELWAMAFDRRLEPVRHFFRLTRGRFADEREFLRANLIFYFISIYFMAWIAHIPMYLALGNFQAALIVATLGLFSALFGALLLRCQKVRAAALSANVGGLTVLIGITIVTGGPHSPIPAWYFFGIMTTFLLLGERTGWWAAVYVLGAFAAIIFLHESFGWAMNGFPFDLVSGSHDFFTLFVYIVSIFSLAMVTSVYAYLQRKAYADLDLAHRELKELNDSVLTMLNNVHQGILTCLADGTVHHQYSSHLCTILGTDAIGGRELRDVLLKRLKLDDLERVRCLAALQKSFDRDEGGFEECHSDLVRECLLKLDTGEEKNIDIEWIPILSTERKVHKILIAIRDVTLEKRLQCEADAYERERISQSKMAALGEIVGRIAHEIINPITVIKGMSKQVERRLTTMKLPQADSKVTEMLGAIQTHSMRVAEIIESMRVVARNDLKDPLSISPLRDIWHNCMVLCAERFKANNVTLLVDDIPDLALACRPGQIVQILINLLNNAHDAVEQGWERSVKVGFRQTDTWLSIEVSDSGVGIPMKHRQDIFNPFFTTKDIGKGTGLGLSISRSIALDHQGDLLLDETSPHTKFILRLPVPRPNP